MSEMTSRERVMAALRRELPDRVPWAEAGIDDALQVQLMGKADFDPPELCRKLGTDAFGGSFLKSMITWQEPNTEDSFAGYYYPDAITFDFVPPWIAEIGLSEETRRKFVKKGLLTSREALSLFDEYLPDPDHPARYERIQGWIDEYKQDYAVFARIRLGAASTIESIGLDVLSLMMYDDPDLVHEIHRRFSDWCAKVVAHLNDMDFDFYWVADDVAGTQGPLHVAQGFPRVSAAAHAHGGASDQEAVDLPQRRQPLAHPARPAYSWHERHSPDSAVGDGYRRSQAHVWRPRRHCREHRPRLHSDPGRARRG